MSYMDKSGLHASVEYIFTYAFYTQATLSDTAHTEDPNLTSAWSDRLGSEQTDFAYRLAMHSEKTLLVALIATAGVGRARPAKGTGPAGPAKPAPAPGMRGLVGRAAVRSWRGGPASRPRADDNARPQPPPAAWRRPGTRGRRAARRIAPTSPLGAGAPETPSAGAPPGDRAATPRRRGPALRRAEGREAAPAPRCAADDAALPHHQHDAGAAAAGGARGVARFVGGGGEASCRQWADSHPRTSSTPRI